MSSRLGPVEAKRWISAMTGARDLWPTVRLVGAYIGSLHNPARGFAYPSYPQISQHLGLHVRDVRRAVDLLEQSGWLEVTRRRGRGHSNEYRINLEKCASTRSFTDPKTARGSPENCALTTPKTAHPRAPNKKDSNVEKGTTGRRSATPVGAPKATAPTADARPAATRTRARARVNAPPAPEVDLNAGRSARAYPASPARVHAPLIDQGNNQRPERDLPMDDTDTMLADIAAAMFDLWNDCWFPDRPPIHPARDSQHQTVDEVCEAWTRAIEHAAAITGSRASAVELYRLAGAKKAETVLAKAAASNNPQGYSATSLKRARKEHAKRQAARDAWNA